MHDMTVTHSPTQLLPETTSILLSRQAQRPLQEPSLATEPVKEVQALSSTSSTQQSPPQASAQVWPPPEMFPSMQTTTSVNERPMSPSSMATSFFVKPRCSARRSPRASPPSSPLGPSRPPSSKRQCLFLLVELLRPISLTRCRRRVYVYAKSAGQRVHRRLSHTHIAKT